MIKTKQIETFEDACEVLGRGVEFTVGLFPGEIARRKLELITEALNGGWTPNWSDSNEYKYYPCFRVVPFGFDASLCVGWGTGSGAGSRLCFETKKLAEYAGKQFADLYEQFIVAAEQPVLRDTEETAGGAVDFLGCRFLFPKGLYPHEIAQRKLEFITKALNGRWKPNWSDSNEEKWVPYFKMSPFGFYNSYSANWVAHSSRLRFKTKKLADLAGKTFAELYEQVLK